MSGVARSRNAARASRSGRNERALGEYGGSDASGNASGEAMMR